MKIFLSWSGTKSHKLACIFRDWLPSVLQYVRPYVSSEDIDKGARWSSDIAKELEESAYGIIFITRENLDAPWVNFEAGALSKTIDKSHVTPFLFDIKRSEVNGPLLQFQSTLSEAADIEKLLVSINRHATTEERIDEGKIPKTFKVWWPQLEAELKDVPKAAAESSKSKEKNQPDNLPQKILEELLELSRNNHKILNSPEKLLPVEYLEFAVRKQTGSRYSRVEVDAVKFLSTQSKALRDLVSAIGEADDVSKAGHELLEAHIVKLQEITSKIADVSDYLKRKIDAKSFSDTELLR